MSNVSFIKEFHIPPIKGDPMKKGLLALACCFILVAIPGCHRRNKCAGGVCDTKVVASRNKCAGGACDVKMVERREVVTQESMPAKKTSGGYGSQQRKVVKKTKTVKETKNGKPSRMSKSVEEEEMMD